MLKCQRWVVICDIYPHSIALICQRLLYWQTLAKCTFKNSFLKNHLSLYEWIKLDVCLWHEKSIVCHILCLVSFILGFKANQNAFKLKMKLKFETYYSLLLQQGLFKFTNLNAIYFASWKIYYKIRITKSQIFIVWCEIIVFN